MNYFGLWFYIVSNLFVKMKVLDGGDGQILTTKNVSLSQSYLQGVERIRKQMNKSLPPELPERILIEREQAWDKLFEKYSENISDDIELNIRDSDSDSKRNGTNDGGNNDDGDKNEYFAKCRTPMRKHPALVQYWVDTGNPPYQLVDENSSLTGSSLSETENSKSTLLILNQYSNAKDKKDDGTSLCSSVDTVAYILSNTNTTKKSETIAIIEGAKNSIISTGHSANLTKENILTCDSSKDCITTNKTVSNCDNNDKLNNILDASKTVRSTIGTLRKTANVNESCSSLAQEQFDKNGEIQENSYDSRTYQITHNSMKITDVLPTLAQFDEILIAKNIEDKQQDKVLSDDASLFERTPKIFVKPKSFNRKKLYTERNSPIDIITSVLNNKKRLSFKSNVHPALSTPTIKRNTLFSRRRTSWLQKRRKKRFSQLANALKNHEKAGNEEDNETELNDGEEKRLESLEITRSNEKINRSERRTAIINKKPPMKTTRQTRILDHKCNDSNVPQHERESYVSDSETSQSNKYKRLVALCSLKNPKIVLERYVEKNSSTNSSKKSITNQPLPKSSPSSSNKPTNNIHELDQESQGSDQSTILIYKCTNEQKKYTMCGSKSQSKLQRKIDRETIELHSSKIREKNTLNLKQSDDNVQATRDDEKNIYLANRTSVIICSTSLIESDEENSSAKVLPKFRHRSQTDFAKSVIKFSSDEEDDFLQIIRGNAKKHTEKSNIDTSTSDQSLISTENNCETLIRDLTCQSAEELKVTPTLATAKNLVIVESDEEDMINSQKSVPKTKKGTTKWHVEMSIEPSIKTRSMSKLSNISTNKEPVENAVAGVLQHHLLSDSSASIRNNITPIKRLKLISDIKPEPLRNNANNPNSSDAASSQNVNDSRKNESKRKTRMGFATKTNATLSNDRTDAISTKPPSPMKQSDTIRNHHNDVRVSLEKLRPSARFTSSCPSSTNAKINKKKSIRCKDDIGSNRHAKMKVRTQYPSKSQPTSIDNEPNSHSNNSSRNLKIDDVKLNDSSFDNNKLFSGSENTIKFSSLDKNYGYKIRELPSRIIFSSLCDDSSSDRSLKFNPRRKRQRINMNNQLKGKTTIFRTRSDDSDSD